MEDKEKLCETKPISLLSIMSIHREDRELQIRLAELQAEIQINLAKCFGLLATLFAVLSIFQQTLISLQPPENSIMGYIILLIILVASSFLGFAFYFLKEAIKARNQMKELRKQYAW